MPCPLPARSTPSYSRTLITFTDMNSISPDTLRRILSAGGLLSAFYAPENTCGDAVPHLTQLITDSRSLYDAPSTIFAAIRTEVNDGRRYIRDMYLRGVRTFIVDELPDDAALSAPCRKPCAA